jgi:NAD(P)-dependent dehydrogenase (short-subunit alcohol dehydrogenase family)
MSNLFNIKDLVVVITGGNGVLGKGMSEYMCSQGAKVVILGRRLDSINELVGSLKSKGYEADGFSADVLDKEQLEDVAAKIIEKYGRIDVLVNGAGGNMPGATIPPDKTFFDLEIEAFRKVVDVNLFGTVLPTMIFAKEMVKQKKGSIINISSEAAIRPLTRVVGYAAAKAAVTNFTQSLATELASKYGEGLRVNAIAPGFFITEQNRALLTNPDGSLTDRGNRIIDHTPFARFGSPDELFGTLHWLASDASKFVTGTLTVVDGGFNSFCI